jgi:hypothetical protein
MENKNHNENDLGIRILTEQIQRNSGIMLHERTETKIMFESGGKQMIWVQFNNGFSSKCFVPMMR